MSFELEGQVAVVTGGASGIGAAIVSELTRLGVNVAIVDLLEVDRAKLEAMAVYPRQMVRSWTCDVTASGAVDVTCDEIRSKVGDPTILVNNAGGSGAVRAVQVEEICDELWDQVLSLNLTSILRFCRRLVPSMKAKRYGKIINVSSTLLHGQYGEGGTVGARLPYVTAKSAIVGMTKQLAKDLGPYGISVNAVAPGFTLPDPDARITRRFEALSPERRERLLSNIPMQRPAAGADIAAAVSFLASPRNTYVSGQIVAVDGGAT